MSTVKHADFRSGAGCYTFIGIMLWPCVPSAHVVPAIAPVRSCRGVAQPGRAPGSGPGGRRFKSSLPDHFKSIRYKLVEEQRVYKRVYIAAGTGGVGINSRQTLAAAMLTASTRSSHHVLL